MTGILGRFQKVTWDHKCQELGQQLAVSGLVFVPFLFFNLVCSGLFVSLRKWAVCVCVRFPRLLYLVVSSNKPSWQTVGRLQCIKFLYVLKIGGSVKQTSPVTARTMESLRAELRLCCVPEKGHKLNFEMQICTIDFLNSLLIRQTVV